MAERAAEVGGEWSATRAPPGGTLVTATLPVAGVSRLEPDALAGAAT